MAEDKKVEDISTKNNENKKIKNLISLVILLGGLFIGSVFVDVVQLIKGGGYSQRTLSQIDVFESAGKTWVAYPDPIVKIQVLVDENCDGCNPEETLVLLRRILPTISATKVDQNSEEGEKMLADLNIKTLPAYIFSKEIEETDFYFQAQQLFEKFNDKYVLKTAEAGIPIGKYIDLPEVSENDIKIGPDDAKVKVIEFSDFQCPFCKSFHPSIKKALEEYGDKIQYVYKHLPLGFHLQAENAALASECANEQGKFLAYADKLFENQDDWGQSEGTQKFKTLALQIGLNASQFNQCLDDVKYQEKVNKDKEEAASFGISGTPGTFINDQFRGGAIDFENLKTIIDEELEK